MSKDLPILYHNELIDKVNTNKEYCVVDDRNNVNVVINELFKPNKYSFNIDSIIETNSKKYETKIAGKLDNNIITIDGDIIPIKDIINIVIKDR